MAGPTRRLTIAAGSLLILALAAPAGAATAPLPEPVAMRVPAGAGSRVPNLAVTPEGRVLLSWLEPQGRGMALRTARFDGKQWSPATTIASGDSFFVNWADFPSVRPVGAARLAAHWLWKSDSGTYAYDVRVSQSNDDGRTWSAPATPHRDGTPTEHGFVSLAPAPDGVSLVWLDGRNSMGHDAASHGAGADMTLRAATLATNGEIRDEATVDPRTCDCCQTAVATTDHGLLVAYRGRSADEVRDILVSRRESTGWSAPRVVHADGWHIPGCPVNGPDLDAAGSRVVIAWYTGAQDSARVRVAFSNDAGGSFAAPVRIDGGSPLGRVAVTLLADGSAVVGWFESAGKEARVQVRHVAADGTLGPTRTVARTSAARGSGFPHIVRSGGRLFVAWTETGKSPRVRMATLQIHP